MKTGKTKLVVGLLALAGLLAFTLVGFGGSLEPSGPPGPTMKTLDEIEARIPIPGSETPVSTFNITQPGSYYLTRDRYASVTAITVEANNVTIDLNGYQLIGPGHKPFPTYGIYIGAEKNVKIQNGTIQNFNGHAISNTSTTARGHHAVGIRAVSNGESSFSGIILLGTNSLIKDCTVIESGGYGIYSGEASAITGNICYGNGDDGIHTSTASAVTGNTCYKNGTDGIDTGNKSTVTGNTCYDNGGDGIDVPSGSVITGNTCGSNEVSGIKTLYGCTIIGNTVQGNTSYGINADDYCLLDQNTAYANGTNIIYGTDCQIGLNVGL